MALFSRESINLNDINAIPISTTLEHPGSSPICFWCLQGLPVDPKLVDCIGDGSQSFVKAGNRIWGCGRHTKNFDRYVPILQATVWDDYVGMTSGAGDSGVAGGTRQEAQGAEQDAAIEQKTENDASLIASPAADSGTAEGTKQHASLGEETGIDDPVGASKAKGTELQAYVDEEAGSEDSFGDNSAVDSRTRKESIDPKTGNKTWVVRGLPPNARLPKTTPNCIFCGAHVSISSFLPLDGSQSFYCHEGFHWGCGRHVEKEYENAMSLLENLLLSGGTLLRPGSTSARATTTVQEKASSLAARINALKGECFLCDQGYNKSLSKHAQQSFPASNPYTQGCGRHRKRDYARLITDMERKRVAMRLNDFAEALDNQLSTGNYKQTSDGKHVFKSTLQNETAPLSKWELQQNQFVQEVKLFISGTFPAILSPGTWLLGSVDKVSEQLVLASKALSNARSSLKGARYDETTGLLVEKSLRKVREMCRELKKEVVVGRKKAMEEARKKKIQHGAIEKAKAREEQGVMEEAKKRDDCVAVEEATKEEESRSVQQGKEDKGQRRRKNVLQWRRARNVKVMPQWRRQKNSL